MDAGFSIGASIVVVVTFGVMAAVLWFWSQGARKVAGAGSAAIGFAAVALAAAGFGVSQFASHPDAMAPLAEQQAQSAAVAEGHGGDMREMAERLRERLQQNPSDGPGWVLLARTYQRLGMHREAADAFSRAIALVPQDATLLADYVDSHVVSNQGKWEAKDHDALAKALSIDPKNLKALALAGTEAYDRKDYKTSLGYWERMKAAALPGSQEASLADSNIAEVKGLLGGGK